MDAPWIVLVSTAISGGIVLAGRWLDRRRGVPTDIDAAIDSHVKFVVDALKTEVAQRKVAEEECRSQLVLQAERITTLESDKDELQRQVTRLLLKLNGGGK